MSDADREPTVAGGANEPPDDDELPPGAVIGDYVVECVLGRGGFGTVYEARGPGGAKAAVKVLHRALCYSDRVLQRFDREARAVATIVHENVVSVYDVGELSDGRPYIAMELLRGHDLAVELAEEGPLSLDDVVAIIEQVCAGLGAAHRHGVVHRDLKASNVVVDRTARPPRVEIVDFGVAKLLGEHATERVTTTGTRVGTPETMAPEQIVGRPVDPRTDVYAVGLLVHQLLTGRLPFRGARWVDVEALHLRGRRPDTSASAAVPRAVDAVVHRCLAVDPEARFETVEEVAVALRAAMADTSAVSIRAVGLRIHIGVRGGIDALDAAGLDDVDRCFDLGRQAVDALGASVVLEADDAIVAVAVAPSGIAEREHWASVVEQAHALLERVAGRRAAYPGVEVSVALRLGDAVVDGERVGGPVVSTEGWPARPRGLVVTSELATSCGLDLDTEPGATPDTLRVIAVRGD